VQVNGCPTPEELAELADGTTAPSLADAMLDHIQTCAACDEILATLEARPSSFVAALAWPESTLFLLERPRANAKTGNKCRRIPAWRHRKTTNPSYQNSLCRLPMVRKRGDG
jgi:hypothetical protein